MNLDREQQRALDAVAAAHAVKVKRTLEVEAEVRRKVAESLDAVARAESLAVRTALDRGVPVSQVGRIGLSSKDAHRAVQRSLAVTAEDVAAMDAAVEQMTSERFRALTPQEAEVWHAPVRGVTVLRVDWIDYVPADGSPLLAYGARVPLHGFVYNTGPRHLRYSVLADDDAEAWTASGKLPALGWAVEEDAFADVADRMVASL